MIFYQQKSRHASVVVYRCQDRGRVMHTVSWRQGKRRFRENIACPDRAKIRCDEIHSMLDAGLDASDDPVGDARRLRAVEAVCGMAVEDLLAFWKKHKGIAASVDKPYPHLLVEDAAATYIKHVERSAGDRYAGTVRCHLTKFADKFGKQAVLDLDPLAINKWLQDAYQSPRTRNNVRGTLATMWARLVKDEYVPANIIDKVEKENADCPPIGVLKADDINRILSALRDTDPDVMAAAAICAFAGVRTAEVERLDWTHIDLDEKIVRLPRDVTKTKAGRVVHMEPNLFAWLDSIPPALRGGRIIADRRIDRKLADVCRVLGINKPHNALRHSYATYAMAIHRNAYVVSENCGHTPRVLKIHYQGLASPSDAREWFNVFPS